MKIMSILLVALAGSAALAQDPAPAASAAHNGSAAMSIAAWLGVLALGAAAGAVGQLVRAISGLAKLAREGSKPFDPSNLVVSLLVGATAGALAALLLLAGNPVPDTPTILGLMGAGYAGADFIEGFAGKYMKPVGVVLPADVVKVKEEVREIAVAPARDEPAVG